MIFKVETKRSGKGCHQFYDKRNGFNFRRRDMKPSGQAYFVCCKDNCPPKILKPFEAKFVEFRK